MQVLKGIRVVDVTTWAFVPAAGGVMAHWGADVVKVEHPRAPDPMRFEGGTGEPGGASIAFKHYSRGKRSIAIDLATPEGLELLYRLVERADVFLTNYLERTRKKLRIDVDDVRARNSRIVYARGSGHGPKGPDAGRGAYDAAVWWCRGSLAGSAMRMAHADEPVGMIGHGDGMSGMTLAGGICAALLQRERTGVASTVDVSLMGTAIWFNGMDIMRAKLPAPAATGPSGAPNRGIYYRTKDDRFIYPLMLGNSDADWCDFCELVGRPDMGSDPRFATADARIRNRLEGIAIFREIFEKRTMAEWRQTLASARGVWAPLQMPEDMYDDPQTAANGFIREVDYPNGPLGVPSPPVLFDEEAGQPAPAPEFGAHTDEVLHELGVAASDITRLRGAGIVA